MPRKTERKRRNKVKQREVKPKEVKTIEEINKKIIYLNQKGEIVEVKKN